MTAVRAPVAVDAPPVEAITRSGGRSVLRRMFRDKAAVIGLVLLVVIAASVLAASWLTPFDPTAVDPSHRLAHASRTHPLGTDTLGRDNLSRILYGGRASIGLAYAAMIGITTLGLLFGLCSGMLGGAVDTVVMRVVEILQALPLLIVAMVVIGLLGGGAEKLVLCVVLLGWPMPARVVRAATLSLRERGFVGAARAEGASKKRIMARHIVPNLFGLLLSLCAIELGRIVLILAALSFLGFGVRPPQPEWGAMLADARTSFFLAPRLLVYPGLAITLLVFAVNLVGDGIRDALDARVSQL